MPHNRLTFSSHETYNVLPQNSVVANWYEATFHENVKETRTIPGNVRWIEVDSIDGHNRVPKYDPLVDSRFW